KEDPLFLYQYAISLQHLGDYEKAARIYGKLSNNKKDKNYLDIKYRYALSLLKTNKESNRKKAKEILKSLKEELKNSSKKEAKELLKYTNQAYEIANKEPLKPKRYKDIVLAEGLQKQYQEYNSTKEAVNTLEAVALKIDKNKDLKKILPKDENNKSSKRKKIKNIDIKTHYLKDSNNIKAKSAGVKISNIASIKNRKIDLYGERFSFENHKKTDGFKIKATLKNKNIKISLGLNKFKDYNDPYASLEYERAIFNHILKIAIERQNALFYENAPYMEKKRISALNLLVRDYIKMIDDKELDIEFTLSRYKDKNIRFTPSFYYLLSKKRIKNVTNSLALAGWYQFYKNRDRHYAYLKKDDATRAEIQSNIPITERLSISPRISAGYSFFNKSALLGYGILMDYRISDYSFISIDCSKHQTKAKSKSSDYNYKECYGDIYYRW
ncbi:MAG: hypothetical protein GXO31_06645, partial [Epsilonproteobacteria bacterium]|nr:hypothetical protein [Campylobacterota bacterium]